MHCQWADASRSAGIKAPAIELYPHLLRLQPLLLKSSPPSPPPPPLKLLPSCASQSLSSPLLHLPSPCSLLQSLKTLVRVLSTHICDTETRLTSHFFSSRTPLQARYIFIFPFIPILSHPSLSRLTDHPSQVAPKSAHTKSTVQTRPMRKSRKTAASKSSRRHTTTRWRSSASRTVGTWVSVSKRPLWLSAARAGAVEARQFFELQGCAV